MSLSFKDICFDCPSVNFSNRQLRLSATLNMSQLVWGNRKQELGCCKLMLILHEPMLTMKGVCTLISAQVETQSLSLSMGSIGKVGSSSIKLD